VQDIPDLNVDLPGSRANGQRQHERGGLIDHQQRLLGKAGQPGADLEPKQPSQRLEQ